MRVLPIIAALFISEIAFAQARSQGTAAPAAAAKAKCCFQNGTWTLSKFEENVLAIGLPDTVDPFMFVLQSVHEKNNNSYEIIADGNLLTSNGLGGAQTMFQARNLKLKKIAGKNVAGGGFKLQRFSDEPIQTSTLNWTIQPSYDFLVAQFPSDRLMMVSSGASPTCDFTMQVTIDDQLLSDESGNPLKWGPYNSVLVYGSKISVAYEGKCRNTSLYVGGSLEYVR